MAIRTTASADLEGVCQNTSNGYHSLTPNQRLDICAFVTCHNML